MHYYMQYDFRKRFFIKHLEDLLGNLSVRSFNYGHSNINHNVIDLLVLNAVEDLMELIRQYKEYQEDTYGHN